MENIIDNNNDINSSMLINPENKNTLKNSFTNLIPIKPCEQVRNQSKIDVNKTHNSTNDTKNNANSNLNTSYQKTFTVFSESNYDSNCITDRSSSNIREIKVNVTTKRKNNYIINNNNQQNNSNNDYNNKDIQTFFSEEEKIKKIKKIQGWWKYNYKIIYIQKIMRGFLLRRHMSKILSLIKSIFKLIFKIVFNEIKKKNKFKYTIRKDTKKSKDKILRKNKSNARFPKKTKQNNNRPLLSESNNSIFNSKFDILKNDSKKYKAELLKKFNNNNNPININKTYETYTYMINSNNNNKNIFVNKNKKNNKDKKDKEIENRNISSKDKIIANNIFNIYNNVKKYYENENNNINNSSYNNNNTPDPNYSTATNFYPKKTKNSIINTNNNKNKNVKMQKMLTRGSMKNINERTVTNRNSRINIKNAKTDRNYSFRKSNKNSILYLLKLKKAFLFWYTYFMKKKILQKMKFVHNMKTPNNVKKTLSIYATKKKEEVKLDTISANKINVSNSLINLKLKKNTPCKIKMCENPKQNTIFKNYTRIKVHSNSSESNSTSGYLKVPESSLNRSLNIKKEKEAIIRPINRNKIPTNISSNSVIVVSQYDRNNEKKIKKYRDSKKKVNNKNKNKKKKKDIKQNSSNKNCKNIDINIKENKKIYLFYAMVNLIDMHSKRKKIKNIFNQWKTSTKNSLCFTNNNKIEEKIISFKMIKPPIKNIFATNQKQSHNPLKLNDNTANYNCQTEAGEENRYFQAKENHMLNRQDLPTPNQLEKSMHKSLFKSNIKSSNIVYQKKVLLPHQKKLRNQSTRSNDKNNNNIIEKEDRRINIDLMDNKNNNNKEYNLFNRRIGQEFYSINTYAINNSSNNNEYINPAFINSIGGNTQIGRINRVNGIDETEVCFTPSTEFNTLKNSYVLDKKTLYDNDKYNDKKLNVNVVENYNNNKTIDLSTIVESRITTKQIKIGEKNRKFNRFSHSHESRIDNFNY